MATPGATEDVYCTLCLSDSYLPGAAVLAHSLRDAGTQKKLACLVDQSTLSHTVMTELQSLYNYVISVDAIGNPHPSNLYLMGRPDLQYTFTKLHLWNLLRFRKVVYIDADVVALRAPEELFDLPDSFAAAPDVGWPDAFNSGVMVLAPNPGEYAALRTMAAAGDSFDGADQGLLNQYFENRPWKRLSFTYNCTPSGNYQYEPAYRYYKRDISLVHFIGAEKPWKRGRGAGGAPVAFQELLSRWWAVWDRHFTVSTTDYIYGGRNATSHSIRDKVSNRGREAFHATGYPIQSSGPDLPPEAQATTTEAPFTDPAETAESIDQGLIEPPHTADVRLFAPPLSEWDATRNAPPALSRPEAANLTVQNYEFNNDPQPFHPPAAYPQPPKDMWYEIPKVPVKKKEEPLAPLFPWEQHDRPAPTRKFFDDEPEPAPQGSPDVDFYGADELAVQMDDVPAAELATPAIRINDEAPWTPVGTVTKNAWDEVSGIENYVRALTAHQRTRGRVQVLHPQVASPSEGGPLPAEGILSPTTGAPPTSIVGELPDAEQLIGQVQRRRESLILTDFPSAIERPSLPVTPAPIRRAVFWGGSKEGSESEADASAAAMPAAEGVPHQADWNPGAQLEQLRRNSLLVGPDDLLPSATKALPDRGVLASAASVTSPTSPPLASISETDAYSAAVRRFSSSTTSSSTSASHFPTDAFSSASSTSNTVGGNMTPRASDNDRERVFDFGGDGASDSRVAFSADAATGGVEASDVRFASTAGRELSSKHFTHSSRFPAQPQDEQIGARD